MPIVERRDPALLILKDGRRFEGVAIGRRGVAAGEVCFNTSMTGYQEILSDPSYAGQIITMTYPEMGNYGVNADDLESRKVFAAGLVVREASPIRSNWRATGTLEDFLQEHGVAGIAGIDTRALTRHIRDKGAQPAVILSGDATEAEAMAALEAFGSMEGADLATQVTCDSPYHWERGGPYGATPKTPDRPYRVVAYDFGMKENILRHLTNIGCQVEVVPATTPAADVLAKAPDGVFLSNGPGDPAAVTPAVEAVRELVGKVPMFGICLGHQIMALALGAKTFKLKYGHRGGNQPVVDVASGQVEITAQNHGFAVEDGTLPEGAVVTHINLNDRTIEGFEHPDKMLFSVQHHPEASPGPHDSHKHFQRFAELMDQRRGSSPDRPVGG